SASAKTLFRLERRSCLRASENTLNKSSAPRHKTSTVVRDRSFLFSEIPPIFPPVLTVVATNQTDYDRRHEPNRRNQNNHSARNRGIQKHAIRWAGMTIEIARRCVSKSRASGQEHGANQGNQCGQNRPAAALDQSDCSEQNPQHQPLQRNCQSR